MEKKWCMCTELKGVARDGDSTCSICGGKDAYGGSPKRPKDKKKVLVDGTKYKRTEMINYESMDKWDDSPRNMEVTE